MSCERAPGSGEGSGKGSGTGVMTSGELPGPRPKGSTIEVSEREEGCIIRSQLDAPKSRNANKNVALTLPTVPPLRCVMPRDIELLWERRTRVKRSEFALQTEGYAEEAV